MNAIQKVEETKCANRIRQAMADREAEFQAIIEDPNSDENSDPVLSIDTDRLTTVCLSYGGPSDYLEIKWTPEGVGYEIKSVLYRFSDWFDTATEWVSEDSPLYTYAHHVIECEVNQ